MYPEQAYPYIFDSKTMMLPFQQITTLYPFCIFEREITYLDVLHNTGVSMNTVVVIWGAAEEIDTYHTCVKSFLALCMLGKLNFVACLLSSAIFFFFFFSKLTFSKNSFGNTIRSILFAKVISRH